MLLSTIIKQFADSFRQRYAKNLLPGHVKALEAMAGCRQAHGPHMLAQCANHQCDAQTYIPHSCGHRNCPHCQNHESQQWIEQQISKRLPCTYYLITFTLPEQLRDLAWRNQNTVYSLMFATVQELLKSFTKNDKKLGGEPGFTTILHTQTRSLDYHPHIHVVMPGASINMKTSLWKVKSSGYLFSHKALAKVFRAKLLQALAEKKTAPSPRLSHAVGCRLQGYGQRRSGHHLPGQISIPRRHPGKRHPALPGGDGHLSLSPCQKRGTPNQDRDG